jgi:hypothetical protein
VDREELLLVAVGALGAQVAALNLVLQKLMVAAVASGGMKRKQLDGFFELLFNSVEEETLRAGRLSTPTKAFRDSALEQLQTFAATVQVDLDSASRPRH